MAHLGHSSDGVVTSLSGSAVVRSVEALDVCREGVESARCWALRSARERAACRSCSARSVIPVRAVK
jgi:hypothetical protein